MSFSVIMLALLAAVPAQASTFLGAHPQVEMQSMTTQELEHLLLSGLASFDIDVQLRAAAVELHPLFAALPKNEGGKLEPTVVRYALHRYFARRYGWHLRGLEPGGGAWNASASTTIMKDRAPSYIMDVFEQRLHGQGLGLEELAVFAITLLDLIHKEAVSDLEDIFSALGHSRSAHLTDSAEANVLTKYLMTYILGVHTPRKSADDFVQMETDIVEQVIVWYDAKAWLDDLRLAFHHSQSSRRNPFVSEYTFENVADTTVEIGHRFGSFQNMECKALKEKLVDMEHGASGRVALSKFYSGVGDLDWPFIESPDYLRNLGALDEIDPRMPSVIIANFLGSPSNCESPSNFYSVCCIDECEDLLTQVELAVAEPSGSVPRLIEVISQLQSDTVAAPRNLSSVQLTRLDEIAVHHGGRVPLHGRLFAQWMHHAYPRECRFPHVAGSTNPLTQREFANDTGLEVEASDEEIARYMEMGASLGSPVVNLPWTRAEELIGTHADVVDHKAQSSSSSVIRALALLAAILSAGVPAMNAKQNLGLAGDKQERYLV